MVKVFVIGYEPIFRVGLAHLIDTQSEFQLCGEADDTSDAVRRLQEVTPEIIIMDVSSRDARVSDAVGVIRQAVPQARVVIITESKAKSDFLTAVRSGVKGYLSRTLRPLELIDSLRLVASSGSVVYSKTLVDEINAK